MKVYERGVGDDAASTLGTCHFHATPLACQVSSMLCSLIVTPPLACHVVAPVKFPSQLKLHERRRNACYAGQLLSGAVLNIPDLMAISVMCRRAQSRRATRRWHLMHFTAGDYRAASPPRFSKRIAKMDVACTYIYS